MGGRVLGPWSSRVRLPPSGNNQVSSPRLASSWAPFLGRPHIFWAAPRPAPGPPGPESSLPPASPAPFSQGSRGSQVNSGEAALLRPSAQDTGIPRGGSAGPSWPGHVLGRGPCPDDTAGFPSPSFPVLSRPELEVPVPDRTEAGCRWHGSGLAS